MRQTHYCRYVVFKHHAAEAPTWCSTRREAMDMALSLNAKNGGRHFIAKVEAFTATVIKDNRR